MKKLLLLFIPLMFFFGCDNRILINDLDRQIIGNYDAVLFYYESELFTGTAYDFYENGQLKSEWNFKDGEANGSFKEYYENGQLFEDGHWKDGLRHGNFKEYYKNGQLNSVWNIKDGKAHGPYKEYDKNGQLIEEGNWKDGVKDIWRP